jgi:hypothetical protein
LLLTALGHILIPDFFSFLVPLTLSSLFVIFPSMDQKALVLDCLNAVVSPSNEVRQNAEQQLKILQEKNGLLPCSITSD